MYIDLHRDSSRDQLRFVFGNSVHSRDIDTGVTYGDIARMFNETTRMRHGNPIAVDVTCNGSNRAVRPPISE
jgi:hypothetical protein